MSEQQPPLTPAVPAARTGGPPRKTIIAKMAGAVAGHAYMSLAVIIGLVILVIAFYVYYHGFIILGPYAKQSNFRAASSRRRESDTRDKGGADISDKDSAKGSADNGDPETESLIKSIKGR